MPSTSAVSKASRETESDATRRSAQLQQQKQRQHDGNALKDKESVPHWYGARESAPVNLLECTAFNTPFWACQNLVVTNFESYWI